ncbi:GcrA family cell cycle regulator [Algicella marina]|uniref:GcrA cell cycle regulator n=1 Tax=Algicella marina TaxID=2683284 RepID=A0A6P1T1C3_9RHOB|nr:GcrA family cell cycle regulator [Algicella marina]QHQ35787.1 GcrA cell cycle regulator [Algicella marina]
MSWTDERVETLKTMWSEGKSASQIAKELGGVTRNAVIGKVHRLGLSNRSAPAKTATKEEKPAAAVAEAKPRPAAKEAPAKAAEPAAEAATKPAPQQTQRPNKPLIVAGQPLPPQPSNSEISEETRANLLELEKKARKLSLMQLTERTCKWPIGDPATEEFWFCGHPCKPGKPYCETHVGVAFQPMSSRRDRKTASR